MGAWAVRRALTTLVVCVVAGILFGFVAIAVTGNPAVPNSVRYIFSPGEFAAERATLHGNVAEQISQFLAIVVWLDVLFYSAVIFAFATWFQRRRRTSQDSGRNSK